MSMEHLSIQELRQALRERGANSRGSKKQLMQRMSEQLGILGDAPKSVAKVRVSIQKSRNEACALLIDPSQSPEHCLQQIADKAKTKFQVKAKHLYIVNTQAQGGGNELTTDNVREYLKDGLVVLASATSKLSSQMIMQADPAQALHAVLPDDEVAAAGSGMAQLQLADAGSAAAESAVNAGGRVSVSRGTEPSDQKDVTDSGSCSSELDDATEQRSVKSFDSESLYSFSATDRAELHPHPAHAAPAPGLGFVHGSSAGSCSSKAIPPKGRGWKWMLPDTGDQQQQPQQQSQSRPPTHPSSPVLQPANAPPALPHSSHTHRNHRCQASAASAVSVSAAAAAIPAAPSADGALRSIMDELADTHPPQPQHPRSNLTGRSCPCCEAGCEVEFVASRPASPALQPAVPTQTSLPLMRSASLPASSSSSSDGSSPAPLHPPSLTASQSISALDSIRLAEENRLLKAQVAELEKRSRRLEASLKSFLKSDGELRATVARLSSGSDPTRTASLEEELISLRLALDASNKEAGKAAWERDRLKSKQQQLMTKNNELKTDSEALQTLRKEHTLLQQTHARLNGHHVNASTSPAVLQELLLLHSTALERVHHQMSANLAAERKELKEKGTCKVCMSKPADVILLPCSHFVLCSLCAHSVKSCPICRSHVANKLPVYT